MLPDSLSAAKGIAGEFSAVCQQVIPAGKIAGNAQRADSLQNYLQLLLQIISGFSGYKGKIQIAAVMVDGTAAGDSTNQLYPIPFHGLQIAFLPRVLVFADDDRILVYIKI